MRVAAYVRVSTDDQSIENQLIDLKAVAAVRNWTVVEIYRDEGISGSLPRGRRPGFNRLLTDATANKFDLIAAWSVDRLGRSLKGLIDFLQEIQLARVDLYLHKQNIDTSTAAGRMLFGMLSVIGEFERALLIERTLAGLKRAKAAGVRLGKPAADPEIVAVVRARKAAGETGATIARQHGLSLRTVWRYLAKCENASA